MKLKTLAYKLWLSIIVTNVTNLSMILFSTRLRLKQLFDNYNSHLSSAANSKIQSNQMRIHNIEALLGPDVKSSQLSQIRKKNLVRVAIVGEKAYWVHDNTFYESDIVDGYIDNEAARPIDAHKLSKREFDKLLKVLDNIL